MAESPRQEEFDREFRSHIERLTPSLDLRPSSTRRYFLRRRRSRSSSSRCIRLAWLPSPHLRHDDERPTKCTSNRPSTAPYADANDLIPDGTIDQDSFEEPGGPRS